MACGLLPSLQREGLDRRVSRAFEMIEKSAATTDLDLSQVARAVNLSTSRLRHLFTLQTGISPMHYAKAVRLQRARSLMLQSFLTVKEVTTQSGFSDVSHFVREYKRVFGETPSETRASHP